MSLIWSCTDTTDDLWFRLKSIDRLVRWCCLLHDTLKLLLFLDSWRGVVPQTFDEVDVLLLLVISKLCIVDLLSLVLSPIVDHVPLKINSKVIVLSLCCWNVLLLELFMSDRIRVKRSRNFLIATIELAANLGALWQHVFLKLRKKLRRILLRNWRLGFFPPTHSRPLSDNR